MIKSLIHPGKSTLKKLTATILTIVFILSNLLSAIPGQALPQTPTPTPTSTQTLAQTEDNQISISSQTLNQPVQPTSDPNLRRNIAPQPASLDPREQTRLIIKYKEDVKSPSAKSSLKTNLKNNLNLSKLETVRQYNDLNLDIVEISSGGDLNQILEDLQADPNIQYAQPDYKLSLFDLSLNDLPVELQSQLFSMEPIGQAVEGGEAQPGTAINALPAWDITMGSPDIIVGILDTGIDINHPDLQDSIFTNPGEIAGNGIDDDGNGKVDDVNGWDFLHQDNSVYDSVNDKHGTHLAGIVGAKADGQGVQGIAPGVKILPLKFAEGSTGYTSQVIEAVHYAEALGVKIINASWGSVNPNPALEDIISQSSMLFVCSAGNDGLSGASYPAAFDLPNVLSVGAVNTDGGRAIFSNYGSSVHLAAPGVSILSTLPESSYGYANGTSMAAAFVSGVAGLLASLQPDLDSAQIAARIKSNVSSNDSVQAYTSQGGIVDAYNTLINAHPPTETEEPLDSEEKQLQEQQVAQLLSSLTSLSEATAEEKSLILSFYGIAIDDVLWAEQQGQALTVAVGLARQAETYGLTIQQTYEVLQHYDDLLESEGELRQFSRFLDRYLVLEAEQADLKSLLLAGYTTNQLRSAYVAAQATSLDLASLLTNENSESLSEILASLNLQFSDADLAALEEFFLQYDINRRALLTYLADHQFSIAQGIDGFKTYEQDLFLRYGEISGETVGLSAEGGELKPIVKDKYFNAPFEYRANNSEEISINSGDLRYETTDLSLPGKNGLDLTVTSRYDSSEAKLFDEEYYTSYNQRYRVLKAQIRYAENDYEGTVTYYDPTPWQVDSYYTSYNSALTRSSQINNQPPVWTGYNYGAIPSTIPYSMNYTAQELHYINWNLSNNTHDVGANHHYPASHKYVTSGNASGLIPYIGKDENIYGTDFVEVYSSNPNIRRWENRITNRYYYAGDLNTYYIGIVGHIYTFNIAIVENCSYSSYGNTTTPNTYNELRHNLGSGWSLAFSSIESSGGNVYLHHSSGNTYQINITATAGDSNLKDHTLNDLRLEQDSGSYSNGSQSSQYVLYYKDGKKEYFAGDGRLLGIQDRFGNTIKFEHTTINGQAVINKITDTAGRVTTIAYTTTGTGKKVVVTAPDQSTVQYILEPIPGYTGDSRLVKKIDPLGRETTFTYSLDSGLFSFYSKSSRDTANVFANLKSITYPTGAVSQYTYEKTTGNFGNLGSNEYYRVKTREDRDGGSVYNRQTYQYTGDYTGFGTYDDPTDLPSGFTYATNIINVDNTKTTFTLNYKHLKTREEVKENGTILTRRNEYEYNANKLPVKAINRIYNKSTGLSMVKVENFSYDSSNFGDLTGYWDSQAQRNSNNMPANDEHKTTMTYHSTYHYLTSRTTKQNASHTLKEEYTPSADGKTVEWLKRYDNGTLTAQTRYIYDSFGNRAEERAYLDGWTEFISTKYNYADNDPARNGLLNGVYLTRTWVEGVKNSAGNLVAARSGNPAGVVDEAFTYDLMGRKVKTQDRQGNITTHQLDLLGRPLKETHPDGSFQTWSYNDAENSITLTNENNQAFKYDYNGLGLIVSEQDLTSGTLLKQYEYDNKLRLVKERNAGDKQVIQYTYAPDDRMVMKETVNNGGNLLARERYEYDDANSNGQFNRKATIVEGGTTTTQYTDVHERVVKDGFFLDGVEYFTTYTYDYLGNKLNEKSARANSGNWPESYTTAYEYNGAGQLTKTTQVNGDISTTQYDALGRVMSTTDNKGNQANPVYSTTYTYDSLGRKIREQLPFELAGSTVHYTVKTYNYDLNGNLIQETVTKQKPGEAAVLGKTEYGYNNRNNLIRVITYDGGEPENYTQYFYDKMGHKLRMYTGLSQPLTIAGLDQVTANGDGEYSATKYEYDRFGQMTKLTDPEGRIESYSYDLNGNQIGQVDRKGSTIAMSYDGVGRLLTKAVTNATTPELNVSLSFTYTLTGNKATMTGGGITTTYTYDGLGRLTKEVQSDGVEKEYTYDAANNQTGLTIKVGSTVKTNATYTYDKLNRMSEVRENGSLAASYTYDGTGNRASLTYANGDSVSYTYNLGNRLKSLANKRGSTTLSSYTYTYFMDGNQATKTDHTGKVTTYAYDGLGRLTQEAPSGEAAVSYTYDDSNNRATMAVTDGAATSYGYDKSNRLLTETKIAGETTEKTLYNYDNNGNQVYKVTETLEPEDSEATRALSVAVLGEEDAAGIPLSINTYDGLNRLVKVVSGDVTATYTYNAEGLRLSKTVNGATTRHIWDDDEIVLELDGGGAVTQKYVRGINLIYSESGGGINYYLFNGHGDVVQLADTSGNVTKNYDYDAFGNEKNPDAGDANVFRYSGEYFDRESGMIYLRARSYDPGIGRFISEDTYRGEDKDPLSLNHYTYAQNNPILYADPSGNIPVETVLDLASIGWSVSDLINSPSLANALFLLWDLGATILPYIPGSYTVKGVKAGAQVITKADNYDDLLKGAIKAQNPLPNLNNAKIDPRKLTDYALNPEHPVGGNKAKVFESALGYNKSNADSLMKQVYDKLPQSEAIMGKLDQYGQRYTVDMSINGVNGNAVTVRTGWIFKPGSATPELTTIYVK